MSRSKQIGTAAETCLVRYATAAGFPLAERLALKGRLDQGDIRLAPGLHVECKGGRVAEQAGPGLIRDWIEECDIEAQNAQAIVFLVRKRRGCGAAQVGRWHAHVRLIDLCMHPELAVNVFGVTALTGVVELPLADALTVFRENGFGDAPQPLVIGEQE